VINMRYAKGYVLLHPSDCIAPHSLDLEPGSRDSIKVEMLAEAFINNGFDPNMPALVGYPLDGSVQLVSGTHRHRAAEIANIMLPVKLMLRSDVEAMWGTEDWNKFIADIPVKNLELIEIEDNKNVPGLDERVNLSRDYVV
jgi:hypothetical protein